MGVQDLLKIIRKLKNHEKGKCYDKLYDAELGNRRIGVDVSVYIHILLSREDFVKLSINNLQYAYRHTSIISSTLF